MFALIAFPVVMFAGIGDWFDVPTFDEVLQDMLDTLKEWTCWLFNEVAWFITDFLIYLVEHLPANTIDVAVIQEAFNYVYVVDELFPVVAWCGMFALYIAFRATWAVVRLVMWVLPGVGG